MIPKKYIAKMALAVLPKNMIQKHKKDCPIRTDKKFKNRKSSDAFVYPFLLVALFSIYFICHTFSVSRSVSHVVLIFPFGYLCWRIARKFSAVSLSFFLVPAVLGIGTVVIASVVKTADHSSFFVSRLQGDELEAASRSFRAQLARFSLRHQGANVNRYPSEIVDGATAREAILDLVNNAVVWGTESYLTVSLPYSLSSKLEQYIGAKNSSFGDILVVESVPYIGLNFQPTQGTIQFLSSLFSGVRFNDKAVPVVTSELALRYAQGVQAGWRSFSHRAYPSLLLGNYYLKKALHSDGSIEKGYLRCAQKAYDTGLGFLSNRAENPPLLGALLNNVAVLDLIRWTGTGKRKNYVKAKKYFRAALLTLEHGTRFGEKNQSYVVAAENVKKLKSLKKSKLKGRLKKKRKNGKKRINGKRRTKNRFNKKTAT